MKDGDGDRVGIGFERRLVSLEIARIVPLKALRAGAKQSKKYTQILSSVRAIGLVEPPVVVRNRQEKDCWFLLDGLLRIEALKDLGISTVECLVSIDDEAYTYNKRINRLSAVQEHMMIVRAMDRGVPAERIAEALELEVSTIQRRFRMLDGICPEVSEMLKDTMCPMKVFEILRQMKPIRQIEATELMIGQNNFSVMFANALLVATPEDQLVANPRRTRTRAKTATAEQMAKMERELASLQSRVRSVEETYGIDNLHLTVAKGYLTKLLGNRRVVRWLSQNRQEYLSEFQAIAEIEQIGQEKVVP